MLPIFGFLLYVVAMLIAINVYELRNSVHREVPLAIIGPPLLLLGSLPRPSPGLKNANYTAREWLCLLGPVACLVTLLSVLFIVIWVSVAHSSFLEEVYDKCFISTVDTDDAPWSEQETRNAEEDHLNVLKEKDNTISMKNEKITKLESELREVQASSTRQLKEAKSTAVKKQDSLEGDIAALREKLHELELSHQAVSIEQDKKLSSKEDDILKFEQGIEQGLEFLVESEKRVAKLHSQELAHLNYKHTKESKAAARRHERANQILQGDHEASMLKLQEYVNQHQHLRVKSESELAVARAENAEASTKIYDINLNRSHLQSDRDQALAAKSSMDNAYQQLVEKNSGLTNGLYEATKAVGDKKASLASASNAVVSLRARLRTQKQKRKEANMKSELLLKSKDERIRRLRNEALAIKGMQTITTKMLKDELDTKDKLLEDKEAEANSSRKAQAAELQRLRSSYAKEILELEKRDRRKLQDIRDDHSKAMAQAKGDLESTQTSLDDKSLAFNSLTAKLDGLQAQHSRTIEELQKAHKEKQNFEDGNAIASKELKDQLASMARLLQDNDAELGSSSKAYATELQRLQTSNAKMTEEFESRQTTIRFSVEEGDVGSNLQSQLQHHSDYVMLLKFWLPSNLASRKAKQTDLRPKEVQGQRKFETQYCIEDPAYTEELLFAEAGSPNIRLPPKPQAQSDSSSSEEEAETRSCTEYLLFAETESPKVRLPNTGQDTPQSVPLPAEDDLDLLVPEYIPLPEDDDLNLLAPQWIPLPEDEDLELLVPEWKPLPKDDEQSLVPEWIPLPEDKDPDLLIPESIPLPSDDDLDLLPDLLDGDDLDLAPQGPTTMPPISVRRGSQARPPRDAPKAPKAMLALNTRGGAKRGSSSRGSSWSRGGWGSYR